MPDLLDLAGVLAVLVVVRGEFVALDRVIRTTTRQGEEVGCVGDIRAADGDGFVAWENVPDVAIIFAGDVGAGGAVVEDDGHVGLAGG